MGRPPDRRKRRRISLQGTVQGTLGLGGEVRVIDLSPGGAMIEHGERLAPGQPCVLGLRLAGVDLRLRAHVAWSQVHGASTGPPGQRELRYRSGLHFPDLPEGAEAHIQQYLATLSARKADRAQGLA